MALYDDIVNDSIERLERELNDIETREWISEMGGELDESYYDFGKAHAFRRGMNLIDME